MTIAFWSNARGRGGTTSNLACLSVIGAIESPGTRVLLENHCNMISLGDAFTKRTAHSMVREEQYYLNQVGLDSLMKKLQSRLFSNDMIKNSALSFLNQQMYYIPQSHVTNKEFFEYEFSQIVELLLEALEDFCHRVYIDTAISEHLSSKTILDKADLVVVNLSQDQAVLEDFFRSYGALNEKAFYLIGNYQQESRYNLKNIIREFRIPKNKIAAVPYNVDFHDALSEGAVVRFITRNYDCDEEDENYYFITQVKAAFGMLQKQIQMVRGERIA